MTTESNQTNSHPKRNVIPDIASIPRWLLAQLAEICEQHQKYKSTGEFHIDFVRGYVHSTSNTTKSYPPGDSQELPAIQKQAS